MMGAHLIDHVQEGIRVLFRSPVFDRKGRNALEMRATGALEEAIGREGRARRMDVESAHAAAANAAREAAVAHAAGTEAARLAARADQRTHARIDQVEDDLAYTEGARRAGEERTAHRITDTQRTALAASEAAQQMAHRQYVAEQQRVHEEAIREEIARSEREAERHRELLRLARAGRRNGY